MAKQVKLENDILFVRSTIIKDHIFNTVKVICAGEKPQVFYKHAWQAVNDPDYLNNTRVCGYALMDLIIIAQRLNAGGGDIAQLKNYTDGFKDGYTRAQADFNNAMQNCVNDILKGLNNE